MFSILLKTRLVLNGCFASQFTSWIVFDCALVVVLTFQAGSRPTGLSSHKQPGGGIAYRTFRFSSASRGSWALPHF